MNLVTERGTLSFPQPADIKALAQETGDCLSILAPLEFHDSTKEALSEVLRIARGKLKLAGIDAGAYLEAFESLPQNELRSLSHMVKGVAFYRSKESTWRFLLPYAVTEAVCISDHFHVTPVLKAVQMDQQFYILALSQKHVRLIRCTLTSSEKVDLPETVPTNLFDFERVRQPDHRLENRSDAGQKGKPQGSHPGMAVAFGTGSDADQKHEYLRHFYNELDKQLQLLLRESPLPLVVAGVDYEIALYHSISEYPMLVPGGVQGAADGLNGGELHARASQVLPALFELRLEKALGQFEKAGGERILMLPSEIVRAACDGRILQLFLAEGAREQGTYDAVTRTIRQEAESSEDLLDLAALQTVAHAGDVFVLPQERVPGKLTAVAALRF